MSFTALSSNRWRLVQVLLGLAVSFGFVPPVAAEETVALRTATGHFVGVGGDGTVHATQLLPGLEQTLLLHTGSDGRLSLRTAEGRSLACGPGGQVRSVAEAAEPESFKLLRSEGNRLALRGATGWLVFDPAAANAAVTLAPPRAEHTVELFRFGQVPNVLQDELNRLIRKAVQDELGGDGYDKTRVRKKQKFVKLPAPTLRDWDRKKRVRTLSMDEEYQVHVQLAGEPEVRLVEMPFVQGYYEPTAGSLYFRVVAHLPLDGHVRYKIPDALSASTGFHTIVALTASGEVRSEKDLQKGQVVLQTPKLLELNVTIHELDVANDALNLLHKPLEEMINDELREKNEQIRQKVNRAIQKAVDAQKFRVPMLEWLLRTAGK